MDDLRRIDTRERLGQMTPDTQANNQVHARRTTENGFERFACEVFQDQHRATALGDERERFGKARDI